MNFILSPTLFNICRRSKAFWRNYQYDRLNVCNVIRSLLFVLLFLDMLLPAVMFTTANAVFQVVFVMFMIGAWNPFTALDFMKDFVPVGSDFDFNSLWHWFDITTYLLAGVIVFVGSVVVCFVTGLLLVLAIREGVIKLGRAEATTKAFEKALTPLDVAVEYVNTKHSKFCRNIEARVQKTHQQMLMDQMDTDLTTHAGAVWRMSREELLASIESNRAILAKYAV